MKIYTKTGDDGTTGLFGGARLPKSDLRIDAYGTVDELCASLGLAAAALPASSDVREHLHRIQGELFIVGAILASPDAPDRSSIPTLDDSTIPRLEREIDIADAQLPPLKTFILPGGSEPASHLHVARTICRRAERLLVGLAQSSNVPQPLIIYLNRLSDWLFVHARLANQFAAVPDIPWRPA